MKPIRLWRALTHPSLLALLMGAMLIGMAAHIALPQTPTMLADDPIARSRWAVDMAANRSFGFALRGLGLFDIAHHPLSPILTPLLAAILFLRLADRLALAWKVRTLSPPLAPLPLTNVADASPEQPPATAEIEASFEQWCERRQNDECDEETSQWIGDRGHRHAWFAALIELGLALILLIFLSNVRFGWQTERLALSPGDRVSLAPLASITISLPREASFEQSSRGPALMDVEGASRGGLMLRWLGVQPGLRVAAGVGDEALSVQAIEQGGAATTALTLRFPQPRSERGVAIPDRNLFLRVVNTGPQQFSIQALDASNALLLAQDIDEPATLMVDDIAIQVQPTYFVLFQAAYRPWLWLLIPAALLSLIGLWMRWRFAYIRVGVRANAAGAAWRRQAQSFARPTLAELLKSGGGR